MPLEQTYTDGGAVPDWIKEGGVVAVVHKQRGARPDIVEKDYVERLTKTLVILNDGNRYSLNRGLTRYGHVRSTYGPTAPFLAEWDSAAVQSALREQFLWNAARVIEQKSRRFADEPTGQKAHELIGLLAQWLRTDGTVVEYGVPVSQYNLHDIVTKPESQARHIAESEGLPLYMRAPGVLAGKWVEVAE